MLAKQEKWKDIISRGTEALIDAKDANRVQDEAKICAQLTSTSFYLGDYPQALVYANRCHELSSEFTDPSLLIRALYLESAIYRAKGEYVRAVEIAEEAAFIYSQKEVDDPNLRGKIYFNLGAAYADNPTGDLEKAARSYFVALDCFNGVRATDDIIRTSIRLGKVYLLQKQYDLTQKTIDEVRPLITSERLKMQADYLEAQLKFAKNEIENATKIAKRGLEIARTLGAKEDEARLNRLLELIEKNAFCNSS
jgi:tetratricopeptide (TPR) repeat protein